MLRFTRDMTLQGTRGDKKIIVLCLRIHERSCVHIELKEDQGNMLRSAILDADIGQEHEKNGEIIPTVRRKPQNTNSVT